MGDLSTTGARVRESSPRSGDYTVRSGDTLYSIAWQYGDDYHDLARWNGITPPYTIYVGQRLRLRAPASTVRSPASPPRRAAARRPGSTSDSESESPVHSAGSLHWQWPTSGPLVKGYDPDAIGKKGITLGGRLGQPVRAAAAGRVVYSGSGLVGYGRLIIVKHNKDYLSAYANNSKLLVKEGERVHGGQVIAQMGSSGTDRVALHFEIRRDGKPVNPLRYLPKR
ncbi:MAG: peptidoglycan DD-metalloendopeptidase family protein [Gammaproteobacteria bacterium]